MNYSLHGTCCHSLFLPLSRQQKYVGKTTIDTFFWRFGDLLHALTIFVAAQWLEVAMSTIMLLNLALALVVLGVSVLIGREHARAVQGHADAPSTLKTEPRRDVYIRTGGRHA